MTSPLVSALLIEAPVNRHFAQLHRDPQALTDAVTLYLETGLRRGNGVVVIASPEHRDRFLTQLAEHEVDPGAFLKSGKLELHDAELMLRKFMRHDQPDWEEFRRAVGAVFERIRAFGRGTTRAYGEMVNLLWQEGKQEAAIRLEEYWNELARLYPFSLFCSYMLDVHHDHAYSGPLEEIGRTHTDVLGTPEDERFRVALDAASRDVFGVPLSQMVGFSRHRHTGEQRFPSGQRTMLWVKRNLPSVSAALLERARRYYDDSLQ
ncbi:MAG TPA: MEDS domain-containing protein [Gemmatimonadales bacterium]|nr:MEDS domain-containing protein [Gemmatimonadales bacterium]